jgi:transcriptional regulator with XRE-family HTH domain
MPRLREWREARGETQVALSESANVSQYTIIRGEAGESVRPSTAKKLAAALGVSVADLLDDPPVPGKAEASEPGPPRVSKEDLARQVISASDHEVEEVNATIESYWKLARGAKAVAHFSHEDVDTSRVMMLVHLVLNTPDVVRPEAAARLNQGVRRRLREGATS